MYNICNIIKTMNSTQQKEKKILLIEPHPYHNEILPGTVKYFQDLGYIVDVMAQKKPFKEDVFCNYTDKPNIFVYNPEDLRTLLSQKKIEDYDFLFLSSLEYCTDTEEQRFLDFLGFLPKTKYGILGIYHNLGLIKKFKDYDMFSQDRIFSLSEFEFEGVKTKLLNPHYFGNYKIKTFKNKKTIFIFAGHLRDFDNIKLAVKKLVSRGIKNFEVRLIGDGKVRFSFWLKKYIKCLGRVSFAKMFNEIEKADFYLLHFDPDCEERKVLLNNGTSGSKQLVLGFLKPCIINEKFAQAYGFCSDDSILYRGNGLYGAMKHAIEIEKKEYELLQNNLRTLSESIYKKSLNNLETSIERIKIEK